MTFTSTYLQIDDAIYVKPEKIHARQRPEQALMPTVTAMGRPGPLGRPCQSYEDQRILSQHIGCQPAGWTLPAR